MSVAPPPARRVIPRDDWRNQWLAWKDIRDLCEPGLPPFSGATMRRLVDQVKEKQALFRPWQNDWNEVALAWRHLDLAIDAARNASQPFDDKAVRELYDLANWVINHLNRVAKTSAESTPPVVVEASINDHPEDYD